MRILTAILMTASLCVLSGCKSGADCGKCTKGAPATMAAAADGDICAKCPGVQLAGTDVKCEKCSAMLKK